MHTNTPAMLELIHINRIMQLYLVVYNFFPTWQLGLLPFLSLIIYPASETSFKKINNIIYVGLTMATSSKEEAPKNSKYHPHRSCTGCIIIIIMCRFLYTLWSMEG